MRLNMRRKNIKFVASRCLLSSSKCIIRKLSYRKDDRAMRPTYGPPENFRESLGYAYGYEILNVFVPIDPMNVRTKFEVRSFTRS